MKLKILERLMINQYYVIWEGEDYLDPLRASTWWPDKRSALRKNRENTVLFIFLDSSADFDTINYDMLLGQIPG